MDRRTFLKALVSFGASIALPLDLATASDAEIDTAWTEAASTWDLFEVSEFRSLSYANFEEHTTRYDAYGFTYTSDVDASMLERNYDLYDPIQALYRDQLLEEDPALVEATLEERVEEEWLEWCQQASGTARTSIDRIIDNWLSEAPDPCREWEHYYKTGDAQGAAYDHFLREDPELMDALGIVVIEGDCPGSSYYAAELHTDVEAANRIAAERGWTIRFVHDGEDIVRYDGKPIV